MDETITITFSKPVKVGEAEFSSVTLCEPTVAQLEKAYAAADNAVTAMTVLIAQVGAIPETAVRKLGQRDFARCDAFLKGFGSSPATG